MFLEKRGSLDEKNEGVERSRERALCGGRLLARQALLPLREGELLPSRRGLDLDGIRHFFTLL